jgi:hypothetical protein
MRMSYINDFTDELSGVMFTTLHRIIIMCNLDNRVFFCLDVLALMHFYHMKKRMIMTVSEHNSAWPNDFC